MDETTLAAYFRRMAVPRPHTADAVSLHVLHRAHQMTVPFENLSIHLSAVPGLSTSGSAVTASTRCCSTAGTSRPTQPGRSSWSTPETATWTCSRTGSRSTGSSDGNLVDTGDGDVDVFKDGKPQYRIERRERSLADFIPTCWWQQTSPESHFARSTICSRLTQDGRVSITGRTLIMTQAGSRSEHHLPDDAAVLTAYRDHFGIVLDEVPHALA